MKKIAKTLAAAGSAAVVLLALAAAAHAAPALEHADGIGLPHDVSVHGYRIDWLLRVTTIFIGILFTIMCIWMFWACIAHGRNHEAHYDKGDTPRAAKTVLAIASIIFLVVDGNLFVNSTVDMEEIFWNWSRPEQHPDHVKIQINAHQWAWDARYAGPDGEFNTKDDVVTLNDIRVPVGVPITMQLASVDVIHSFYLPNLRIKQDVMPGMINRMWFQARETGEFDIGCAQHCGTNHYLMKGLLTVLPMDEYQRWLSERSEEAVRRYDEQMRNGVTEQFENAQWGWEWKPANI